MILYQYSSLFNQAKTRYGFILTHSYQLLEHIASSFVLQHFFTIKPMLNVFTLRNNARCIPFADRINFFITCSSYQIIERTNSAITISTQFGIGVNSIIQNLELEADSRTRIFWCRLSRVNKIFNTAIRAGG